MLTQKFTHLTRRESLLVQLAIASATGLVLGGLALRLSPVWVLAGLAGLLGVLALLKRPEFAVLGILVATSSIIYEGRLPLLPIGVGSLHVPDVLLLSMLGLILVRRLVEPDFEIIRTPLDWPILTFYGIALLATFMALSQSTISFNDGFRAIRFVTYYLTFFVITNLVRTEDQLRLLVRGFFFLATLVAVVMVAQFVVGESVSLLPGRVETLETQGQRYTGITRVIPPGRSLVVVGFIALTAILVQERLTVSSLWHALQWGLLGTGLTLLFFRTFWVATAVSLLLLAFVAGSDGRRRLMLWSVAIGVAGFIIVLPFAAQPDSRIGGLIYSTVERAATLGDAETVEEGSLEWRYIENGYAFHQIASAPILGLGLGSRYRPLDLRLDSRPDEWDARKYIHNGHLWILVKTGMLGWSAFLWMSVTFLVRGFSLWRTQPAWRGTALGFTLAYTGLLIAALLLPIFTDWPWIPVIGSMLGVNEVIFRGLSEEATTN